MNVSHSSLPLSMVSPNEKVCLMEFRGSHTLNKRLADMGLIVGDVVRVVQGDPAGPMILAFKNDARLALGRGVAQHIIVTLVE
jgi:Fe2+ transport system protein FeoA